MRAAGPLAGNKEGASARTKAPSLHNHHPERGGSAVVAGVWLPRSGNPPQPVGERQPTMTTGQKCSQSGIYQSACGDRLQIALSRGDTFPPCRNHGSVSWQLIQATQN